MRRLLCLFLSFGLTFSPITPLWADAPLSNPLDPSLEEQRDLFSAQQMESGQQQAQAELSQRQALAQTLANQFQTSETGFTQAPSYTNQISTSDNFEVTWTVENTSGNPEQVTLVTTMTPVGWQQFGLALAHTGTALHETGANFELSLADWNRDGVLDLVAIQKSATGSNSTEVHVYDGASGFQTALLHTGSALEETGNNVELLLKDWNKDGVLDLIAIQKNGTGSNSTEVHIYDGASSFQAALLHTGTALPETRNDFEFSVEDWNKDGVLDLIAIQKSSTASGSTEVHIYDGASNFQTVLLQTGTALHPTFSNFEFSFADWNKDGILDFVALKKSGTGSNSTEVHVYDGAESFQTALLHTGTALQETADNTDLQLEDWNRDGVLDLILLQKSGTASGSTEVHAYSGASSEREFSAAVTVPPGGGSVQQVVTASQLSAAGIDPGQYTVSFQVLSAEGQRVGQAFFGNPLTIGTVSPAFDTAPTFSPQIPVDGELGVSWALGNTGAAAGRATLVAVFTPAGTTGPSIEMARLVRVPAGGGTFTTIYTAAERTAAGITPGSYTVSFVALDGLGNRIGGPTHGFFGNPLEIGSADLQFSFEDVTDQVNPGDPVVVLAGVINDGDASGRAQIVATVRRVEDDPNDPTSFQEFTTGFYEIPPMAPSGSGWTNGVRHLRLEIPTGTTEEPGRLGPGQYVLTGAVLDLKGNLVGERFSQIVQVGSAAAPAMGTAPVYPAQIPLDGVLETDWTVQNTGAAPAAVTLIAALTPIGGDPTQTVEFSQQVQVPAGGGNFDFDISAADRTARGVIGGEYLIGFVALRPDGSRIGEFFNLVTIGTVAPSVSAAPAYPAAVPVGSPIATTWTVDNTGDATAFVALIVGMTLAGSTSTTATVEFSSTVRVQPGGGTFDFTISPQQLSDNGIGAGNYLLSFVAVRPNSARIGEFFGNPLQIGTASPAFNALPIYTNQIAKEGVFEATYTVGNTGDAPATMTLTMAATRAGAPGPETSEEFSQVVTVPPGGGTFTQTIREGTLQGRYLISFLVVDANGNRVGELFTGNRLTVGAVQPTFDAVPQYRPSLQEGEPLLETWTLGNSGDAADWVTLVTAITRTGTSASVEFSTVRLVPPQGLSFDVEISAAELAAAGIGVGDYTVSFVALNGFGERIGEFFGNLLRIGEAQLTVPAAPIYSARIGTSEDFTAQWTFGNGGPVSADVSVLTVFTKVGTTDSIEIYRPGLVPAGTGGTVNVLLTAADRAAAGITDGDYTLAFVAFDADDNRIAEFFGNPLAIGAGAPAVTAEPSYTSAIPVSGDFSSAWSVANSGSVSAVVTLVAAVTPVGATDPAQTKEFPRQVTVPAGGASFDLVIANADLLAAGIVPGRYQVSFVAFEPSGNRIGEFFARPLTIGTIAPSLPAAPTYSQAIAIGAPFQSDWSLGNSGDAPDRVTLVAAVTPVGATDPAQTKEFSQVVTLPAGGAGFDFDIAAADLAANGIVPGQYLVTFTAFDGVEQRIGNLFVGNPLTIGTSSPMVGSEPIYTGQIPLNGTLETDWTVGNTGDAPAAVTLVAALTPIGGDPLQTVEFSRTVQVPVGGGSFDLDVSEAARTARGVTGGEYLISFVALRPDGSRIGEFFNLVTIGNVAPAVSAAPVFSPAVSVGSPVTTAWTVGNTGDAPAFVTLVVGVTPAGSPSTTAATVEFSSNVRVLPGGGTFDFTISPQQLTDNGIGAGDYVLSFVALRPDGTRVGEFFGNLLRIGEAQLTVPSAPVYSDRIGSSEDFTAQWTFGNGGSISADVNVLTVFTKVGTSTSIEVYRPGLVPAGTGGTVNVLLAAADRAAEGITDGDYTLAFVAFDADDNRIAEFFGNPLAIGSAALTLPAAPSYTDAIGLGGDFDSSWNLGNSGSASGAVTLVASVTPVGGTDSDTVEFRKVVSVPAGGEALNFSVANTDLDTAGITGGRYLVSFVAFDPAGTRLGEFFGLALTIGTITPSLPAAPTYSQAIAVDGPFQSNWTLDNNGDAPDRVTLVTAITPVGATDPAQTKEFSQGVTLPVGGAGFNFDISAAGLASQGIVPGRYLVTFTALDGAGNRVGGFFGNPLTIGNIAVGFPQAPVVPSSFALSDGLTLDVTFQNSGDTADRVTALVVFTPPGSTDPAQSREFYITGLAVPPGSSTHTVTVTRAQLEANGITPGNWLVAVTGFDGAERRLETYAGNPVTVT